MGALTNAIRKILGTGERPASGGLVLAARHYDRVNQTVRRIEARGEVRRPTGPVATPARPVAGTSDVAHAPTQVAARPNLADWDLPPGLASVVQAEATGREAPAARRPTNGPGPAGRERKEPADLRKSLDVPLLGGEMEELLSRLAE